VWIYQAVKKDVHLASISGGTDIISCFMLGNPCLPVYPGEIQCAGLGMAIDAWDEKGNSVRGQRGELVCTKPFPSMPVGFWRDLDGSKFYHAYFDYYQHREVWRHGDFIEINAHNGIVVHGRSDTTLNPGGVRIGTAELYRVVEMTPWVADSLAISRERHTGDPEIALFVKCKNGLPQEWQQELKQKIRQNLSPRHVPQGIYQVSDIPYTRSGKKVELAVFDAVHGREVKNRDAMANPEAVDACVKALQEGERAQNR
jgi:acetoacetyl-CoA synthetase